MRRFFLAIAVIFFSLFLVLACDKEEEQTIPTGQALDDSLKVLAANVKTCYKQSKHGTNVGIGVAQIRKALNELGVPPGRIGTTDYDLSMLETRGQFVQAFRTKIRTFLQNPSDSLAQQTLKKASDFLWGTNLDHYLSLSYMAQDENLGDTLSDLKIEKLTFLLNHALPESEREGLRFNNTLSPVFDLGNQRFVRLKIYDEHTLVLLDTENVNTHGLRIDFFLTFDELVDEVWNGNMAQIDNSINDESWDPRWDDFIIRFEKTRGLWKEELSAVDEQDNSKHPAYRDR